MDSFPGVPTMSLEQEAEHNKIVMVWLCFILVIFSLLCFACYRENKKRGRQDVHKKKKRNVEQTQEISGSHNH